MLIKNNMRRERERVELKQADVARKIGTTQSTYSLFETGRALPEADELAIICDLFGVKPEALYGGSILTVVYGIGEKDKAEKKRRPFFSVKIPIEIGEKIDAEMTTLGYATRTEYVVETVRRRLCEW